ncbi:MAG: hypothetical protein E7095_03510 [Bacteroides sp.]|nr:hypothetical protein [Bacteroides sp.]
MEDIFQILVFVAFAVLSFLPALNKGKKDSDSQSQPQPFLSEEELEEVFPAWVEDEVPAQSSPQKIKEKQELNRQVLSEENCEKVSSKEKPAGVDKKIRLNSRSEAKRAFIYSEIFNRKYS